jgi:hypothetical protein
MTQWTEEAIERRIRDWTRDNPIQFVKPQRKDQCVQTKCEVPPTPVVVHDVEMPSLSTVNFMVKGALASIPALLILFIIGLICWAALLGPLVRIATFSH